MAFRDGFTVDSIPATPTPTSGNLLTYDGEQWVDLTTGSLGIGDITSVAVGSNLSGGATSGDVVIALSNNISGLESIQTSNLTASHVIVEHVTVYGTASVTQLNTINQQSLNVGDKFITILTGGADHASLDGSGILWGRSGSGEPTLNEFGSNAHVRFRATTDSLEIFPHLTVSGSASFGGPINAPTGTFTELTASSLSSSNLSVTALNASSLVTQLQFKRVAGVPTVNISDASKIFEFTNVAQAPLTFNIPSNSAVPFPIGTKLGFIQRGAGQVTFDASVPVTLLSLGNKRKMAGQYAYVEAFKVGTNEWYLVGDLIA